VCGYVIVGELQMLINITVKDGAILRGAKRRECILQPHKASNERKETRARTNCHED
jgi:hypothetical protein